MPTSKPPQEELARALQELARIRRRLTRVNQHKLPIYFSLQPRVFATLGALQQALDEDAQTLTQLLQHEPFYQ